MRIFQIRIHKNLLKQDQNFSNFKENEKLYFINTFQVSIILQPVYFRILRLVKFKSIWVWNIQLTIYV